MLSACRVNKVQRKNVYACAAQTREEFWAFSVTFTRFPVCDVFCDVTVKSLLAVVAMSAVGVVLAVDANAARLAARQFIEVKVEATFPRVFVTVAR